MGHSKGKIYLSDQMGVQAFSDLVMLNEETLAGSAKMQFKIEEESSMILIPITGDLFCTINNLSGINIDVGTAQVYLLPSQTIVTITNPYELEEIKFLQIRTKVSTINAVSLAKPVSFDLQSSKNKMIELYDSAHLQFPNHTCRLSIGQFDGRSEVMFRLEEQNSHFTYVISGAFEIAGRLLHAGDGLALWDIKTIEVEALSNYATLLAFELPAPV